MDSGLDLTTALTLAGFAAFLWLFRAAMRRRGRDWDGVWRADRRPLPRRRRRPLSRHRWRPVLMIGAALGAAATSDAQQTIFNVPTADVLDRGKTYLETDALWRLQEPNFAVFTGRGAYGLGAHIEAGVNFGGFFSPGRSVPIATPNIKWQPWHDDKFAVTTGLFGLFFLRGSEDGDPAALWYGHASYKLPTDTRLTAGGYWASSGYAAAGVQKGALAGFEQKLDEHLNLIADWFSGENGLGYFTPGFSSTWGPWTLYAGYSFKNGDSKGNAILFELGFLF